VESGRPVGHGRRGLLVGSWLLRRGAQAVATFVLAVTLLFFLMRIAPGDPLWRVQENESLTPEARAVLERMYGIDRPLPDQFATFLRGVARGDLGSSIGYGLPVTTLIAARLPATLLLGGTVLLLNFTLGIWLGVRQAVRRGRAEDHVLALLSLACYATPSFWLGLMLAWLFAIEWRVLPSGGLTNPLLDSAAGVPARMTDVLAHLVLPAITLSTVTIAATMRYQRAAMLEVLRLPYIVTARAKGLPESRVTGRHAWRNALFPVITIFGLWLPILVTGSVFVEEVFAWPGLGSLAAGAATARDYPLLMGASLLAAALVVLGSLLTDAAYAILDPRVRPS
jgi:peptide/nickel transport system permease protein